MGIRGLTTFIARYSDKYLEDYKLKDCQLVIDGNSLTAQIYVSTSNFNCAFGGDYDRYAVSVIEFFDLLKKCRVKPIVIFDGGYEARKFKTTYMRLKQKWFKARHVTPVTQSRNKMFPCILREAFKDVLRDLNIPFAQCLFEADEEIAALAKHLKCPVLSYDSDFFVYDVLYIPFPTLRLYPYKDDCIESPNVSYYVSCSLYRVENFLRRYGGLQKEILPFVSIMLGNDYIGNKVFKNFVSHLKKQKGRRSNPRQRKIAALFEWLRTETFETAMSKVMRCLRKEKREHVAEQVRRVIVLYTECSSELLPILGIETASLEVEPSYDMNRLKQFFEKQSDTISSCHGSGEEVFCAVEAHELDDDSCNSSFSSSEEGEDDDASESNDFEDKNEGESLLANNSMDKIAFESSERKKASYLPEWFREKFQQGAFPSMLMDILIFDHYFLPPQVEDYDYPSSHTIVLPIIAVIYGLLVGCERKNFLKCYVRKRIEGDRWAVVNPVLETASVKFPSLELLPDFPVSQKLLILKEAAGLNIVDQKLITLLPLSWQLYVISMVFWARRCEHPVVNSSHIDALLLCLLLLDVLGKNAVCLGSKKRTRKNRKKVLRQVNLHDNDTEFKFTLCAGNSAPCDNLSKNVNDKCDGGQNFIFTQEGCNGIEELFRNSSHLVTQLETFNLEECDLVKKLLRPLCKMEEKMKTRPNLFCITTVHTFAQFQSTLLHFTYLNTLLDMPLPHCVSFRAYNGTFVYNMYNNLKQRKNAYAYISQLLSVAPSILSLFTILREVVGKLIPEVPKTDRIPLKKCKKKKCHKPKNEDLQILSDKQSHSSDTDFEDPCNRFAALSVVH